MEILLKGFMKSEFVYKLTVLNTFETTDKKIILKMQNEVKSLINKVSDLQCQLNITCESLREEIDKRVVSENSKKKLKSDLKNAKQEQDSLKLKL